MSNVTSILSDVRYAFRSLLRTPGFTAVAIGTLAVGIGATTAIFSAVYSVVLRPFPFPEPERVIAIGEKVSGEGLSAVSAGNFDDWRRQGTFFQDIAARSFVSVNVTSGTTPERVVGNAVTHTYFSVFRIPAALGRTFTEDEDRPGNEQVVVLSDALWTRMFARDPQVIGRTIQLDGRAHTVVGVMPLRFKSLTGSAEEFWIPAALTPAQLTSHDGHGMTAVARLKPDVSIQQAASELEAIFTRVKASTGDNQVRQGVVAPYGEQAIGDLSTRLLLLFGAVNLVLLIACSNVAHLLLARGRLRAHEIGLRASLGASRGRIVRQLLAESLVLAVLGGALGVLLTYVAVSALLAISPDGMERLNETTVSTPVLLFALAVSVMSALVAGVIPALQTARVDLRSTLNEGGRTFSREHDALRSLLVAGEVAVAIVLLAGAGLLVRSAIHLQTMHPGFDATAVLTGRVSLPTVGYESRDRVEQTFLDLVARLQQSPALDAAAVSSSVPMTQGANNNGLVPEGQTFNPDDFILGRFGLVTEDYFRAFRIPLIEGRLFTVDDRRNTERVMILSATAARQLFPAQSAIGKRVACCELAQDGSVALKLVVGVVGDVRSDGPAVDPRADFYLPVRQAPPDSWDWLQRTMTVVVRGAGSDSDPLADIVRATVNQIDPGLAVHNVATMPQRLHTWLARDRFNMVLMILLGAIGFMLSAIGIYGVSSCFVAQRHRELAIRTALGAQRRELLLMVLHQGMRPVWLGVAIGVVAAFFAAQAISGYIFGIATYDPLTFGAAVLLLIAAAVLANVIPARAASYADPARLLVG